MGAILTRGVAGRLGAVALAAGVTIAAGLVAPATPAQAVPGHRFEVDYSRHDSSPTKEADATCPAGTVILGGGGMILGSAVENVRLTALVPYLSAYPQTGYRVRGEEYGAGYDGSWGVVSFAICGRQPAGWMLSSRSSPLGSSEPSHGVAATCLAGRKVIGAGASIFNGGSKVGLSHMLPSHPNLTSVAAVAHEDPGGYAGMWSVQAHAVCADPIPGLEWVPGSAGVWPVCPAGKTIHGVGGYLTAGWGEVQIEGIFPFLNGAYAQTSAGNDYAFTVAVCAD